VCSARVGALAGATSERCRPPNSTTSLGMSVQPKQSLQADDTFRCTSPDVCAAEAAAVKGAMPSGMNDSTAARRRGSEHLPDTSFIDEAQSDRCDGEFACLS
jgi:hypothetical protein